MSVHSWKQLALWSLEYSCLSDVQQREAEGHFTKAWEEFCTKVVTDYRHLFDFSDGKDPTLSVARAVDEYTKELNAKLH